MELFTADIFKIERESFSRNHEISLPVLTPCNKWKDPE